MLLENIEADILLHCIPLFLDLPPWSAHCLQDKMLQLLNPSHMLRITIPTYKIDAQIISSFCPRRLLIYNKWWNVVGIWRLFFFFFHSVSWFTVTCENCCQCHSILYAIKKLHSLVMTKVTNKTYLLPQYLTMYICN